MLVNMYKLEYKIENTIFIKSNKTGEVNIHTNVFILFKTHFEYLFEVFT